jgi:hypothetical protein
MRWEQVNTWRLSQHCLLERADRQQMLDVVSRIGAVHAQVMSAAELQLAARIDGLSPADVQNALWHDRTLIKTWLLRGTLHLVTAADFPMYIAALDKYVAGFYRRPSWLKYHGVTPDELDAIVEGIRTTLGDEGMTREQLADAIVEHTGKAELRELLRSGWGALLKPAAHRGYLGFGPSQGQNVTFVQPARWLGEWTPVDPAEAAKEIARRYLAAYGPATTDDFGRWMGMESSAAKRIFRSLDGEIEEVDVEGWKAWALVSSLKQVEALKPSRVVRLVPGFDPYVVAFYRHCQYIMPEAHKARVYRQQGWISPVVLVGGRMEGVWEYDKKRSKVVVKVEMFAQPDSEVRQGIDAEASRLGKFLDTDVEVSCD